MYTVVEWQAFTDFMHGSRVLFFVLGSFPKKLSLFQYLSYNIETTRLRAVYETTNNLLVCLMILKTNHTLAIQLSNFVYSFVWLQTNKLQICIDPFRVKS